MLSLQALLSCPNPDDPQDAQVAGQYKKDITQFEKTAKYWTEIYATPKKPIDTAAAVKKLTEMGFAADKSLQALQANKFDENAAMEWLLTH